MARLSLQTSSTSSSPRHGRSQSIASDLFDQIKYRRRSQPHRQDSEGSITPSSPSKSRRDSLIDFFKTLTRRASDENTQSRPGSAQPPSPRHDKKRQRLHKSIDIQHAYVERLMGKPKQCSNKNITPTKSGTVQKASVTHIETSVSTQQDAEIDPTDRSRLTAPELHAMFEGAPRFSVARTSSEYRPLVTIPDLFSPCEKFDCSHVSFDAANMQSQHKGCGVPSTSIDPRDVLLECPFMQTTRSSEIGTSSFEQFLAMPLINDQERQQGKPQPSKRNQLLRCPHKHGLRKPDIDATIDRLSELGVIYSGDEKTNIIAALATTQMIDEMGEHLFRNFLATPSQISASSVPLEMQVEALLAALGMPHIWYDFSDAYLRLRVGKLLWPENEKIDSKRSIHGDEGLGDSEMLLLQIMLAGELLVRLKMIRVIATRSKQDQSTLFAEGACERLEALKTTKTEWDLVLAERFLRSIEVSSMPFVRSTHPESTFTLTIPSAGRVPKQVYFASKLHQQQIDGLLRFAADLHWPDEEDLHDIFEGSASMLQSAPDADSPSAYATLCETPTLQDSFGEKGYFSDFNAENQLRSRPQGKGGEWRDHTMRRVDTLQNVQIYPSSYPSGRNHLLQHGTWLSRSWLSGFVMPGDSASHLLISTLLEHSPRARQALGETANLRAGFVYQGRSLWSKKHVVGRVMAAVSGASECMGWVSLPSVTVEQSEGWIHSLVTEKLFHELGNRIESHESISRESGPLGLDKGLNISKDDFTYPRDGHPVMGNEVHFDGIRFDPSTSSSASMATLAFSSPINPKLPQLELSLTYDVHFVAAHPCYPTGEVNHPEALVKQASDSFPSKLAAALDLDEQTREQNPHPCSRCPPPAPSPASSTSQAAADCHALHRDYSFSIVPVASLLSSCTESGLCEVVDDLHNSRNKHQPYEAHPVVLDCRGSPDLQLLARAWCAHTGENALVARRGVTCLACAVREARALRIAWIIRV